MHRPQELASPWTRVLFAIVAALQSGNAFAFFKLMALAPYSLAAICASHVLPMRQQVLAMLAAAMGGGCGLTACGLAGVSVADGELAGV